MSAYCYNKLSIYLSQSMMMIGASCGKQVVQTACLSRRWAGKQLVRLPEHCSLSLPFVPCFPEIYTTAVVFPLLICLIFLLFFNFLAFIGITANNCVRHIYNPRDPMMSCQQRAPPAPQWLQRSKRKLTDDPKRLVVVKKMCAHIEAPRGGKHMQNSPLATDQQRNRETWLIL